MATLEALVKSIGNKIRMLEFTSECTCCLSTTLVKSSLERKLKTLPIKLQEVYDLETQTQEATLRKAVIRTKYENGALKSKAKWQS